MFLDFLSWDGPHTSQIITCDSINVITLKFCIKMFIEVVKSHSSFDNIGILTNFTNFHTSFICFVVNLTNDFFQKVLEGNKTSNATVFIKQDSHLIIGVTKGCQEIIYEDSLWNKERFVHDSAKFDIFKTKFKTCF